MQRLPFIVLSLAFLSISHLTAEEKKAATGDKKKEEKVTFDDHVLPIFRARCGSCHNSNDRRGGLVLDQYAAMMEGGSSGAAIEPGDGEFSYLWLLINHEDTPKMPPNADKLPENELATIKKWIDLGALENAGSTAKIKKKPKLDKIEVSTERPKDVAMPQNYLGEPVHTPKSQNAVTALTCSPWAPITAVSGYKQIGLYHSETLVPLGTLPFPEGQPQILKFSRNGSLLLAGGGRGGQMGKVVLYDVKTGERKIEVGNEYDEVLAADISPDQSLVALGGPKKMLRVYSTLTGELVYEVKKHTDWITAIEFSPDGVLLASGDRSAGLIVWEADAGKIFYDLTGHRGGINDVSWRPDSNVVASASADGTIKLWEMQNGNAIKSWNAHGGGVTGMDYTREGNVVSVGRDKLVRLWKGDGAKLKDFRGLTDVGMEVAYDAETKRVLGGDWTGSIRVWNSNDAAQLGEINTNPPTASMVLSTLEPQLQKLKATHATAAKALTDISAKLTARKTAADKAVALASQAMNNATQATAKKVAAQKDVAAKVAALNETNQNVAASKTLLEKATATSEKAQQVATTSKTKLDQHNSKVAQVKAAAAAAEKGVAQATETLKFQTEAAKPTPDEQAVLKTNPEVQAAVTKRQELVKQAEAQLTFAKLLVEKTGPAVGDVEKQLVELNKTYQSAAAAAKKASMDATNAEAAYKAAMQAQAAAQKAKADADAMLTKAVNDEKAAVAQATKTKADADKLVAAAKPTADEQKALQAAQAAEKASQANLKVIEDQVKEFKAIQSQVASTASNQK